MRFIVMLALVACGGDADEPSIPPCAEMGCTAIACGELTPDGDAAPTLCTCDTGDGDPVTCSAE